MTDPRPAQTAAFSPHVHGARGLFALMIFVHHMLISDRPAYPLLNEGALGAVVHALPIGVELFFCISGFVIIGALGRAASPAGFLHDRIARIGPVLWSSVLIMGVAGVMFRHRDFVDRTAAELAGALVAGLVALPGIVPIWSFNPAAWSISYEFAFYILCAAAVALQARIGPARAALAWVPAAILLANFYPRGLPFLVGVLVAQGQVARLRAFVRAPGLLLCVFAVAWASTGILLPDDGAPRWTTLADWASDLRLPLGVVGLVALALGFQGIVDGTGWLARMLVTRPMLFLGTVSYSLYMWHLLVIGGVRQVVMPVLVEDRNGLAAQLLFPVITTMIVIPVSVVSHRLLEGVASARLRRWWRASGRPVAEGRPVPEQRPAGMGRTPRP